MIQHSAINNCILFYIVHYVGMMNDEVTGTDLHAWREKKGINLEELGALLGGVTGPTISRWENGQDIPGPAQLLLGWLIHGKVPFGQEGEAAGRLASSAWKVEMTLEAFEKLRAKALAAGFEDLVDYIAQLVLDDLAAEDSEPGSRGEDGIALLADEASPALLPERKEVTYPKPKKGGRGK